MTTAPRHLAERGIVIALLVVAVTGPAYFNEYWVETILTQTFILGIAAASLVFLSAYGGMVSLAQTALMGIAGYMLGNMVTQRVPGGETKGLTLGWDPTVALVMAIVVTTVIGLIFGALAARSFGIYFLMLTLTYAVIANYFFGQVTQFGGFSPIAGINQYMPGWIGPVLDNPEKLYYIALGVAVAVYLLVRYVVRTPFGLALQGVRDEPIRMASLGYAVPVHRMLAFGLAAFVASLAGVLYVWWQGQISPDAVGLASTIELLIIAVIGGLGRIEFAWLGAFVYIVINTYIRDSWLTDLLDTTGIGGSFNTIIGVIFLAIVIVSPDGLSGLWERLWKVGRRGQGPAAPAAPTPPTGPAGQEA